MSPPFSRAMWLKQQNASVAFCMSLVVKCPMWRGSALGTWRFFGRCGLHWQFDLRSRRVQQIP
eukprot:3717487-Amphidinium_carterae.1